MSDIIREKQIDLNIVKKIFKEFSPSELNKKTYDKLELLIFYEKDNEDDDFLVEFIKEAKQDKNTTQIIKEWIKLGYLNKENNILKISTKYENEFSIFFKYVKKCLISKKRIVLWSLLSSNVEIISPEIISKKTDMNNEECLRYLQLLLKTYPDCIKYHETYRNKFTVDIEKTFNVLIENINSLFEKGATIEDDIVDILERENEIYAKAIHRQLIKFYSRTVKLDAVYKALQKLDKKNIIERSRFEKKGRGPPREIWKIKCKNCQKDLSTDECWNKKIKQIIFDEDDLIKTIFNIEEDKINLKNFKERIKTIYETPQNLEKQLFILKVQSILSLVEKNNFENLLEGMICIMDNLNFKIEMNEIKKIIDKNDQNKWSKIKEKLENYPLWFTIGIICV